MKKLRQHRLCRDRVFSAFLCPLCVKFLSTRCCFYDGQLSVPVVYKEVNLECGYRLNLLFENKVVVELKSFDRMAPIHEAIKLAHLRLSGHKIGLLMNCNVKVLKDEVGRIIV